MSQPLISVVIPVYNQEKYIAEALESVLAQKGVAFEVVVVNDGSTDRSAEILQAYAGRITVLRQENKGEGEARNTGIRSARGELIALLDGDDRYLPGHLRQIAEFEKAHPEAILFYGDAWIIDPRGKRLYLQKTRPRANLENLLMGNFLINSGTIIRMKLFEQGEWYHPWKHFADWDLWMRATRYGSLVRYPWVGLEYRKHPESALQSKTAQAEEITIQILNDALARNPELDRLKSRALSNLYCDSGIRFLAAGHAPEARQRFRAAMSGFPLNLRIGMGWLLSLVPPAGLNSLIKFRRMVKKWMSGQK